MTKNVIAAVVGSVCTLFLCDTHSFAEGAVSGTSLNITGAASISGSTTLNSLVVTGTVDIRGNSLYFGSWVSDPGMQGVVVTYTDASITPTPSLLRLTANQPSHEWLWEHNTADQTSTVPMMKLDANHVLTIYDTAGNPAIVLNPAGSSAPTAILTQQSADSRYVSNADFSARTVAYPWGDGFGPAIALTGGTATAAYSFAGISGTASGYSSTASGAFAAASGAASTASGYGSISSGECSVASGAWSTASGSGSVASGYGSAVSGECSTSSGAFSTASGPWSTASGALSTASGAWSTSSGPLSTASGTWSTASGISTVAQGYFQTVVGVCNLPQGNPSSWIPSDDLFTIGNGILSRDILGNVPYDAEGNPIPDFPSNAFVVKKNGDTTVYGKLTVSGSNGSTAAIPYGVSIAYDDGAEGVSSSITLQSSKPSSVWNWNRVTASGTSVNAMQLDESNRLILTGTGDTGNLPQLVLDPNGAEGANSVLTQQSADSRYVSAANFHVSSVWDEWGYEVPSVAFPGGSAGYSSFAGIWATANGSCATAIGNASTASGHGAVAIGHCAAANGGDSAASGAFSFANGMFSSADGAYATANGDFSSAAGAYSTAASYGQFVVGQYNIPQGDPSSWVPTDELFTVGNGTTGLDENGNYSTFPSNAFVVKKNGDTTVYGKLTVSGSNGSTAAIPYGVSIAYDDGAEGVSSSITLQSSKPSSVWNWNRVTASGTSVNAMQLDESNRLILTGTGDTGNLPQLVLDPNGAEGANSVLTQQSADSRYVSAANFHVGSIWDEWGYEGPTVAFPGGSAGYSSFAGIWATANGSCATAIGNASTASGHGAVAIGHCAAANGGDSAASGAFSFANGMFSSADGAYATANGDFSSAAGAYSTAASYGQFVVGQYNIPQGDPSSWVPTDELFTVGNGTTGLDENGNYSTFPSNAFVVKKNGDTTVYGKLTVSGTSGGLVVMGTAVSVTLSSGTAATKIVASGNSQLALVPEQGDLSMGDFINGPQPQ